MADRNMGGYHTLEVRWFRRGPIPALVASWFKGLGGEPQHFPPRVDRYVQLPGTASVGVKLREGGIEIKVRETPSEVIRLTHGVAGWRGTWCKWRFAVEGPAAAAACPRQLGPSWRAVTKERCLWRRGVDDDGRVVEIDPRAPPPSGCDLELATVGVSQAMWWTVAFEAYGDRGSLERAFDLVTRHTVARSPWPLRLDVSESFSYPQFLRSVASKGDSRSVDG